MLCSARLMPIEFILERTAITEIVELQEWTWRECLFQKPENIGYEQLVALQIALMLYSRLQIWVLWLNRETLNEICLLILFDSENPSILNLTKIFLQSSLEQNFHLCRRWLINVCEQIAIDWKIYWRYYHNKTKDSRSIISSPSWLKASIFHHHYLKCTSCFTQYQTLSLTKSTVSHYNMII